jgi:hypothetical protein
VDLREILKIFEEVFDHPAPARMMSERKNRKITRDLFANSEVVKDLKEAASDNKLIYDDEGIMRIVHEAHNDRQ